MVTVGQQLIAPEEGWKRYDDINSAFKCVGNWTRGTYTGTEITFYNKTRSFSSTVGDTFSFKFIGDKLRIISEAKHSNRPNLVKITVDGEDDFFSLRLGQEIALVYEKIFPNCGIHDVIITVVEEGKVTLIDAIDINEDGRLLHPDEVIDVGDLEVGKRIRFGYSAASGQFGSFYGLGAENGNFIPAESSATPNGDAYFIMVDTDRLGRKILVADRNIQHSIPWDALNMAGVASGSGLESQSLIDNLGVSSPVTITRSSGIKSNVGKASGKWYFEFAISRWTQFKRAYVGIGTSSTPTDEGYQSNTDAYGYHGDGVIVRAGVQSSGYPTYDIGDIIGVQLDLDNGEMRYYKNGVLAVTMSIPLGKEYFIVAAFARSSGSSDISFNLGMKPFIYEVPQGIRAYNDSYSEYMKFTIRLLTGGVSNTDKDNEWDKYIVHSTLNETITAGDDTVWNNMNHGSLTSTASPTTSSHRVIRGYNGLSNWTYGSASLTVPARGFRPVLVITHLPTFEGSVDKTSIHHEDVTLTGVISDPENDSVQYRILVNGVQEYPETGFTVLAPPPISINYTISNSKFMLGNNQITVKMVNSKGVVGTWATSVTLDSQAPAITASMTGNGLDVSIVDPESDSVRFRVLLNGTQVHPADQTKEFTDLMQPTVLFSKLFRSNEVNIGSNNTVTIIAQDQFGKESTVTLNFIGEYAGLMFADENGEFYSDDLGNVLKYLDIEVLVAGQVSNTYPIRLINRTGFKVKNIELWKDRKTLPPSAAVEISKTSSPFEPTDLLVFDETLDYNEEVTFYVRVVTQINGQPGQGEFDVYVKADPS